MSTYRERMEAYAHHAALLASQDNTPTLRQAARWIKEADKIVVGGAAGLSAAGGMDYMSHETLEQVFPQLSKKAMTIFGKPCGTRSARRNRNGPCWPPKPCGPGLTTR